MQPGDELAGRFRVIAVAREGGMARIYRGRDLVGGVDVAIKVLTSVGADVAARFDREARLLATLDHPAIVRHVAHGHAPGGEPYLVLEWLDGEDLAARLHRADLTIGETARIGVRIADACGALHRAGIVHRDIKPGNVFLPGGRTAHATLLDLGIARLDGGETVQTSADVALGTPAYIAPEQARAGGVVDTRADLYSLGCVLFRCLAGRTPFVGDSPVAVMVKAVLEDAPRLAELRHNVPPELDELVARLLARDPAARPASAAEVSAALAAFVPSRTLTRRRRQGSHAAIGGAEQHLVTLVLAAIPDGERTAAHEALAAAGATPVAFADGVVAVTVTGHAAATDQSRRGAELALRVRAAAPGAALALATGRAEIGGRMPFGEVVDRAVLLLAGREPGRVGIDELTAALLDADHPLRAAARPSGAARTLLGAPSPFVGRARELGFLEALHRESADERIANVGFVTGAPGAGKSRLRSELAARLAGAGVRVLEARAAPRGTAPFALLRQLAAALAELLDTPDPSSDAADPAAHDPIVAGDRARRRFLAWLADELDRGPMVLLLDDLQWADRPSLDFVEEALRLHADRPLLVVGFARAGTAPPWRDRVTPIELGELSPRASAEIVRRALGDPPDEVVDPIVRRAGGNAFYLEEIVRAVAAGAGPGDLPATVIAMAQARLEALTPEQRRWLRAASIFGRTFTAAGVAALLGDPDRAATVARGLAELIAAEVLIAAEPPALLFRHDLLREAAYAMLTDDDRVAGHRRAARWLAEHGGAAAVIAEHYRLGDRPDEARGHYGRAAARAVEAADFASAVALAEHALAAGADGVEAGHLHALIAQACRWLGRHPESARAGRAAMDALGPDQADWYRAAGLVANAAGNTGDMEALVAVANALAGTVPVPALLSWQVVALARAADRLLLSGRRDFAESLLARLDELAAAPEASYATARAWLGRVHGFAALSAGDHARFVACMLAAAEDFEAAGDLRNACLQRGNAGYGYLHLGATDRAARHLEDARAAATELGLHNVVTSVEADLGVAVARLGRPDEARLILGRVVAAAREQGNPRLESGALGHLALLHLDAGEPAAAATAAAAALEAGRATLPTRAIALAVSARVALAEGRAADAVALAAEAAGVLGRIDDLPEGESLVRLTHADALAAAGRAGEAADALATAAARVRARAAAIADPELRAAFLEREPWNARVLGHTLPG